MSNNLRDPNTLDAEQATKPGLDPDELWAEQAGDLPERDAMSVIGVGGLEVGLPPAGILDGVLDSDLPVSTLPVDGLPVEQLPIDQLPIDRLPVEPLPPGDLPVEQPVGTLPVDSLLDDSPGNPGPVDDDRIGIPVQPASADVKIEV